ncbi:MAG: ribosome biogenesis factor YjgA [Parahaliea sp.]
MIDINNTDADFETEDEAPSKSARKRQMNALQALGERLTELSDKQLKKIPIEETSLRQAVIEARSIHSNSARRRHMQFIGKLMRNIDPVPIEQALESLFQQERQSKDRFHQLEQLRDELLQKGTTAIEQIMSRWPQADRQHLRQLLLQHQRENRHGQPPAASRKLFRYLRQLQENE